MAASLSDVTDVLRKQIEHDAAMAVELKAITRALEGIHEVLEEIRDNGGMSADDGDDGDEDDDEDDEEGDGANAGLDGMVDTVAREIRERIRSKGLKGLLNRKKPNGHAPKEARTTTDTE